MIEGLGLLGMRKEAYRKSVTEVLKTVTDALSNREAVWNFAKIPGTSRLIDRLELAFRNGVENRRLREELESSWLRNGTNHYEYKALLDTMPKLYARNALKENPLNVYKWMEGMGAHPHATLATAVAVPTTLYLGDKVLDKTISGPPQK